MVGAVWHFAPSAAPPPGQKTDTRTSLASQLTPPSSETERIGHKSKPNPSDLAALPSKRGRFFRDGKKKKRARIPAAARNQFIQTHCVPDMPIA
jgi:hypothetical protein